MKKEHANPLADFTNGWEEGFFTEVFGYGRECSVQFSLEDCPPFRGHVKKTACEYKGVTVVEVSRTSCQAGSGIPQR
jgi:hypothetical protein